MNKDRAINVLAGSLLVLAFVLQVYTKYFHKDDRIAFIDVVNLTEYNLADVSCGQDDTDSVRIGRLAAENSASVHQTSWIEPRYLFVAFRIEAPGTKVKSIRTEVSGSSFTGAGIQVAIRFHDETFSVTAVFADAPAL